MLSGVLWKWLGKCKAVDGNRWEACLREGLSDEENGETIYYNGN